MKEERFNSLEELYRRLLPALRAKKNEMTREKVLAVTEQDIWHFLCQEKWRGKNNLTLGEMVDDILNADSFTIFMNIRKD